MKNLFPMAALALILAGCAGQRPALPSAAFPQSPEAALRALAASSPGPGPFTATTRILIDRHGERYPLKVAMMAQPPALLRVESIPLMGPPDFHLSIAEGELRVFLPAKGAFYTGRALPANLSRFLFVSLPAEEMISLLMGMAPEFRGGEFALAGERDEGLYRIDERVAGRKARSLWIDPENGRLVRIERFPGEGSAGYRADFSEPVRIGGGILPQRVMIREEQANAVLTVRHADLRPIAAGPDAFPLPIPDGVAPTRLDP